MRPYNKAVYIWDSRGGLTRHKQTVWGCSIGRIVHTMDPHGGKIWLLCNDTIKHKISLLFVFFSPATLLPWFILLHSKTHAQVKHGDKIIQNYCWSLTHIQLFTLILPNWMESNKHERNTVALLLWQSNHFLCTLTIYNEIWGRRPLEMVPFNTVCAWNFLLPLSWVWFCLFYPEIPVQ